MWRVIADPAHCRFKDVCLDVADLDVMAAFWTSALGLRIGERRSQVVRLDGDIAEQTLWLNAVPEPRSVKNRVHLDVRSNAVAALVEAGATVLDEEPYPWVVLADPEGGEFCAFPQEVDEPSYRLRELAFDCRDPGGLAAWWADRFATTWHHDPAHDYSWIDADSGLPWNITFAAVPEPKRSKNRVHLVVWGDTTAIVDAGATGLRTAGDDLDWDVLADPEGNEFFVFAPR